MDIVIPLIIGVSFWGLSFLKYKYGKFKEWDDSQPKLVFFPKYQSKYYVSDEHLKSRLTRLGFRASDTNSNLYTRGKIYGDFSLNKIRLNLQVVPEQQTLKLFCPSLILFDTGDMWKLTKHIIQSKP